MVISYYGKQFFKVQFGDRVLAFNPPSKKSKFNGPRFGADIVLVTNNHPDYNGSDMVGHGDKEPFVIAGPGEYERNGISVKGVASVTRLGGKEKSNTMYVVSLENMKLGFLGALGDVKLSEDAFEQLDDIDILFVPIGGEGELSADVAYKFAAKIAPHLIIPMDYGDEMEKGALKQFLKEAGESPKPEEKATLKKKDVETKEGDILLLEVLS